ncbi:serine/threonine protein kinase [Amycolatopsis antarctica]|uniref:Serine/threonine protein kinase n=2 Tax=Amycolatopsis antarctica TaxID=1854586 RepID=A0A263D9E9_9PSEU|nr:serine/threonine protein kinase [Amycolatopsis antarctica]
MALDKHAEHEVWSVTPEDFWCFLHPPGYLNRNQGWKLHVSATPVSAPDVLERAARVLIRHRCAFKYAKGIKQIEDLVSSRADRGSGGKFITAYPNHDDHFREVIDDLHEATCGLAGPGILSDKPYRAGSLVHYRYGGFSSIEVLNTEGSYQRMLVAPDGTFITDERNAWFSPPTWAPSPLKDTPKRKDESTQSKQVKLADRFVVREAIRHSYRGGVYRALDTETGENVIIKQARPHTGADITGNDSREWMRHEAKMLDELYPLGFTPRKVMLFDYQGDQFLAEEEFTGNTLRHWCEARLKETGGEISAAAAEPMARSLIDLLAATHEQGFVLRDFNPGNIVVPEDDQPRLIDLEFLARAGDQVRNVATIGYVAPEQMTKERHSPAPDQAVDLYSLGATLLYLTTRIDPVLAEEDSPGRTYSERLAHIVRATSSTNEAVRHFAPMIIGLTAHEPDERWTLRQAREYLDAPRGRWTTEEPQPVAAGLGVAEQDRMLHDGLAHVVEMMKPDEPHLWPPIVAEGMVSDPCNVQGGAGGVLAVLNQATQVLDDAPLRRALGTATTWLDRTLPREPRVLPGLYFGRSGAAWALYDAAKAIDDEEIAERALAFAKRIPNRWFNPDITHGMSGAGTTMLHLWKATGDPEFAERVHACARAVIKAADQQQNELSWPVPAEFNSMMAGVSHHGFAHGVAGISNFLLTAGQALDCPEYIDLAIAGGRSLSKSVMWQKEAALWPTGEKGEDDEVGLTWWCSGSAGVGTFLIRLWQATGDHTYRELAEASAVAVHNERWLLSPTACHGVTGGAEFLLDLAAILDEPGYRDWAEQLAASIYARSMIRDGRLLAPNDTLNDVSLGYNTGLAGVLSFLLRLRHGGTRLWMAEDLTLPASDSSGDR